MNVNLPVVRARWCDTGRIVDLVTDTVSATALAAWLVPDQGRRRQVLAAVTRIWVEHALLFGDAFLLRDGSAATVWFHRYRPLPAPPRYAARLAAACGADRDRFLHLDRSLARRRPAEAHNHLALLAAPGPDAGERALAVVTGAQHWMDTLNLPTYAEALSEADRDLYRRLGYADRDAFPVPGDTTLHALWRLPPALGGGNARWPARRRTARTHNGRAIGWALR
ncbi:hypothetical protein [Micromonospora sp. HK10]|uniref:hypothetical protein n=1 Tax=Micromonospora sp. HK10 TaxID=1538294 RepID=UPI000626FC6E|nr:hypothetical protein [Micromonospora sp. HK10]KKK04249.1 hypothetical protein LQ51_19450 [Micromonospora sp. HK10]